MPRKLPPRPTRPSPAPPPVEPPVKFTSELTQQKEDVKKIKPGKRPCSPPKLELGGAAPAFDGNKKPKTVSFHPSVTVTLLNTSSPKGPEPPNYWILQHTANKHLTYLVAMKPGETQGCFVYFFPYLFFLDKEGENGSMPCVKLTPAPARINVTAVHWWANATFPESRSGLQYFPMPQSGFNAGDYISLKYNPGAYGWVSAVIYRISGEKVYLVCAVVQGVLRLLMKTRMELEGPEFTFVPPEKPLWSKSVFPLLHEEHPDRYGYFEQPDTGFEAGDPVTVFEEGKRTAIDAKVVFVWKGLPVNQYNVELPGGRIVLFKNDDVLGPRVDRLNADLNPAHITPDPDLLQSVEELEKKEAAVSLYCAEEMPEQLASPSGVHSPTHDVFEFTTPPHNLMDPHVARTFIGGAQIPHPGVLINAAAHRISARDNAGGT